MNRKKSFADEISKDFGQVTIMEPSERRASTKPMPSARLIPLEQIIPDPGQPRKNFSEEGISELAESIKTHGILEPVSVRQDNTGYVIITGERRYRASQQAGLSEIPCVIKQVSAEDAFACQLIENIQRQDLTPVEEALAVKRLCEQQTQQEAAKTISKSQPYVSKLLSIAGLPEAILSEAAQLSLTKEHLFQVSKAEDPVKAWEAAKQGSQAKSIRENPPKKCERLKPWTWKPEDKSFTLSVRFKKGKPDRQAIIEALENALQELRR